MNIAKLITKYEKEIEELELETLSCVSPDWHSGELFGRLHSIKQVVSDLKQLLDW
jgi:hypothetical protein